MGSGLVPENARSEVVGDKRLFKLGIKDFRLPTYLSNVSTKSAGIEWSSQTASKKQRDNARWYEPVRTNILNSHRLPFLAINQIE